MLSGKSIEVAGKTIVLSDLLVEAFTHGKAGNKQTAIYTPEIVCALLQRIRQQESLEKDWFGTNTYLIGTDRLSASAISREFDKAIGTFDRKRLTEIVRGLGKAIADLRTNGHPCYKNEENGDRKYLFAGGYYTLSEIVFVFKKRTNTTEYGWNKGFGIYVEELLNIIQELSFGPPPVVEGSFLDGTFLDPSPLASVTEADAKLAQNMSEALNAGISPLTTKG